MQASFQGARDLVTAPLAGRSSGSPGLVAAVLTDRLVSPRSRVPRPARSRSGSAGFRPSKSVLVKG